MNIKKKCRRLQVTWTFMFIVAGILCGGLSACFKVDTPPGTKLVSCRIVKPDGTNVNSQVEVFISGGKIFWRKLIPSNSNGIVVLPAISSTHQNSQPQEYLYCISCKDGYWATHDPNLIREGAKIQLEPGGWINVRWAGSGLPLDNFSFESERLPELSSGLHSTYRDPLQRPPGPFIINALPSSCPKDAIIRDTKYGILEAGKTITLELGKRIKDYEIKCLLPQNLPDDLKFTLSLQVNPDQNSKIKPYFCLIAKSEQEEVRRMAEEGVELFSLENWPIDADGTFRFIADETWAKVIISAKRRDQVLPLQSVEFGTDEARMKTVDLQTNELLLKLAGSK